MLGGIYASDVCAICGSKLIDNGKDRVCCPAHPKQRATTIFVRFKTVFRRFTNYEAAFQFLHGLRFKTTEGTFDERDYQKAAPLGFANMASKYLERKRETVRHGSYVHIKHDIERAIAFFGQTSVKEIQYGDLEDFLLSLKGISDKTRHNIKASLHTFFVWLVRRRELRKDQMPEFPELSYELGWRRTIDKATQELILVEVKRLSSRNPRIWLGVKWLTTYVSLRPSDLLGILEEDIDLERGTLLIVSHKTSKHIGPKAIPLIGEDVEIIRTLARGFPKMPFFRRERGGGGKNAGAPFGKHLLYDYWKRACGTLGIEGVDLYGGTRHSTMQHLRARVSVEGVKRLSLHRTNRALDRYLEIEVEELRTGYEMARNPAPPAPILHRQRGRADP